MTEPPNEPETGRNWNEERLNCVDRILGNVCFNCGGGFNIPPERR